MSLRWQGVACRAGRSLEEVLLEAEGGSQNMGCQGRRSGHIRHESVTRRSQLPLNTYCTVQYRFTIPY